MPDAASRRFAFQHATHADADRVAALINAAYAGTPEHPGWTNEAALMDGARTDAAEVAALIAAPGSTILMCMDGTRLAGSVNLKKIPRGAYFGLLAIDPALQGAGIGKQLIEAAELIARNAWRCEVMTLTVISHRPELVAFYERRGYRRTGESKALETGTMRMRVEGLRLEGMEKRLIDGDAAAGR